MISRRALVLGVLACSVAAVYGLSDNPNQVSAAPQDAPQAAAAATNPFHGTYRGGYWGGDYGGDVTATVTKAGKVTVTLPGAGLGTVSPTGAYSVKGKLNVSGFSINVTYTGKLVAIKHPATGAFLAVVGSGTWVTTSGPRLTGKWLVQRTALTP